MRTRNIKAGVSDDGPERIHTGTGSGGLGRTKGGDGAAYVCPAARAEPLVLGTVGATRLKDVVSSRWNLEG